MKMMEPEIGNSNESRVARIPEALRPCVGGCVSCHAETVFSPSQVAAAYRIWEHGSGQPGLAATGFLGGDGTTNQCGCGMEGEVVCTGRDHWEVQWRRSRLAADPRRLQAGA